VTRPSGCMKENDKRGWGSPAGARTCIHQQLEMSPLSTSLTSENGVVPSPALPGRGRWRHARARTHSRVRAPACVLHTIAQLKLFRTVSISISLHEILSILEITWRTIS
jgi:hypothetical protein